jgi:hypothetical protein
LFFVIKINIFQNLRSHGFPPNTPLLKKADCCDGAYNCKETTFYQLVEQRESLFDWMPMRRAAEALGAKEIKKKSMGQLMFEHENDFISLDITSHNGYFWKILQKINNQYIVIGEATKDFKDTWFY